MDHLIHALYDAVAIRERSKQLRQQVRAQREERRLLMEHRRSLPESIDGVIPAARNGAKPDPKPTRA